MREYSGRCKDQVITKGAGFAIMEMKVKKELQIKGICPNVFNAARVDVVRPSVIRVIKMSTDIKHV